MVKINFNDLSNTKLKEDDKDKINSIISNNTVLNKLNGANLLFFEDKFNVSTRGKIVEKSALNTLNEIEKDGTDLFYADTILKSFKNFITIFYKLNNLRSLFFKGNLDILVINKVNYIQKEEELGEERFNELELSCFEGLNIQSIPYYDGATRMDVYDYYTQSIDICLLPKSKLPKQLKLSISHIDLLIHEFTHAIDDTYNNLNSVRIIFDMLRPHKNSGKLEEILSCATKIVDDEEHTFDIQYKKLVEHDIIHWVEWLESHSNDSRPFQIGENEEEHKDDQPYMGALVCSNFPSEFIAFSVEKIFSSMKFAETIKGFEENYKKELNTNISKYCATGYTSSIISTSYSIVKNITIDYLDKICMFFTERTEGATEDSDPSINDVTSCIECIGVAKDVLNECTPTDIME